MRPSTSTQASVFSNFDHELDEEIAKALVDHSGRLCAQHAAWNFSGWIWLDPDTDCWVEEIWVYQAMQKQITSEPRSKGGLIQDVINQANQEYGSS